MGRFHSLYSGSSGNVSYLSWKGRGLIIDAGVSCKMMDNALAAVGAEDDTLEGVLITHEHSDHIKGLSVFLKRHRVGVYASAGTLSFLEKNGFLPPETKVEVLSPGKTIAVAGVGVTPFSTSHDAAESLGFCFEAGETHIGYATDLGEVGNTEEVLKGCQLAFLEANYDPEMLKRGPYPYSLKRRITGEKGHLSNDDCAALALSLAKRKMTQLFLAHLSHENNLPDVAHQTISKVLMEEGMRPGKDYLLGVAKRHGPSKGMYF